MRPDADGHGAGPGRFADPERRGGCDAGPAFAKSGRRLAESAGACRDHMRLFPRLLRHPAAGGRKPAAMGAGDHPGFSSELCLCRRSAKRGGGADRRWRRRTMLVAGGTQYRVGTGQSGGRGDRGPLADPWPWHRPVAGLGGRRRAAGLRHRAGASSPGPDARGASACQRRTGRRPCRTVPADPAVARHPHADDAGLLGLSVARTLLCGVRRQKRGDDGQRGAGRHDKPAPLGHVSPADRCRRQPDGHRPAVGGRGPAAAGAMAGGALRRRHGGAGVRRGHQRAVAAALDRADGACGCGCRPDAGRRLHLRLQTGPGRRHAGHRTGARHLRLPDRAGRCRIGPVAADGGGPGRDRRGRAGTEGRVSRTANGERPARPPPAAWTVRVRDPRPS